MDFLARYVAKLLPFLIYAYAMENSEKSVHSKLIVNETVGEIPNFTLVSSAREHFILDKVEIYQPTSNRGVAYC